MSQQVSCSLPTLAFAVHSNLAPADGGFCGATGAGGGRDPCSGGTVPVGTIESCCAALCCAVLSCAALGCAALCCAALRRPASCQASADCSLDSSCAGSLYFSCAARPPATRWTLAFRLWRSMAPTVRGAACDGCCPRARLRWKARFGHACRATSQQRCKHAASMQQVKLPHHVCLQATSLISS